MILNRPIPWPIVAWAVVFAALAGAPASVAAATDNTGQAASAKPPAKPKNDAPAEQHLFGDWCGVRPQLHDSGVELSFDFTGQVAANVSGGRRSGADQLAPISSR